MAVHMERVKRVQSPKLGMRSQIAKPITRKKSVASNTVEFECPGCEEKDRFIQNLLTDMNENNRLREDYLVAIKYINSCHNFINKFVHANDDSKPESEKVNVNLPDIPNFLSLFTSLYKVNQPKDQTFTKIELDHTKKEDTEGELKENKTPTKNFLHKNNQNRAKTPQMKRPEIRQVQNKFVDLIRAEFSDTETNPSIVSPEETKATTETIVVKPPKKHTQIASTNTTLVTTIESGVGSMSITNVPKESKRSLQNHEQKQQKKGVGGAKKVDCGSTGSIRSIPKSKTFVGNTKMGGDCNKASSFNQLTLEDIDKYASELLESAVRSSMNSVESKNKIATKKVSFVDEIDNNNKMSGMENPNLFTNENRTKPLRNTSQSDFPTKSDIPNDTNSWMNYYLSNHMNNIMATCANTIINNCNQNQNVTKCEMYQNTLPFNSVSNISKGFPQNSTVYNCYPTFDEENANGTKKMFSNVYSKGLVNENTILRDTTEVKNSDSIILSDQDIQNDSIDTEFIPSDSDVEFNSNRIKIIRKKKPKTRDCETKFPKCFSDSGYLSYDEPKLSTKSAGAAGNPFQLNKRSMEMLDQKMISTMGLFTQTGDVSPVALKMMEHEKCQKARDKRNKIFRTTRNSDSNDSMGRNPKGGVQISTKSTGSGSDPFGSTDSSDIKSDGEYGEELKRRTTTKLPKPSSPNSGKRNFRF